MIHRLANRRDLLIDLLAALLALLTAFFVLTANSPLYEDIGGDNPIFLTVAKGLTQGMTPYVDLVENKGPLLFWLNALPQYVLPATLGVFVLEALMLVGSCLLLCRCARRLGGRNRTPLWALIPVGVYLARFAAYINGGNYCEEYNAFLLLVECAMMIDAYTHRERGQKLRAFWIGAAFAAIVLIKVSEAPTAGVIALFYAGYILATERKRFLRELGGFVAGVAAVSILPLIYLISTDSLGAMLYEYILSNFSHVSTNVGFLAARAKLLSPTSGYFRAAILSVVLSSAALVMQRVSKQRLFLGVFAVGVAAAAFACAYVSQSGFTQHLIPGCVPCALAVSVICQSASRLWQNDARIGSGVTFALASALCCALLWQSSSVVGNLPFVHSEAWEANVAYQTEFLPDIADDKDSVFCVGVPRKWYCCNDVLPAYKYMNLISYIANGVGEELPQKFLAFLEETPVTWLVFQDPPEAYRELLGDDVVEWILNNYSLYSEDSKGKRELWCLI